MYAMNVRISFQLRALAIALCLPLCVWSAEVNASPREATTASADARSRTARVSLDVGTAVGQMHPDFLLPTIDGQFGRLSDYRGKKVLLIHFASW